MHWGLTDMVREEILALRCTILAKDIGKIHLINLDGKQYIINEMEYLIQVMQFWLIN